MHWIDPDHLPETTGIVSHFLLNPHGESDGLILADGVEVHFPPHLSDDVRTAVRTGDQVAVRGVRPRGADMIAAIALRLEDGTRIVDSGPPKDRKHPAKAKREPMQQEGIVRRQLHGPKGEVRGVLLEDGLQVRFPKHHGKDLAKCVVPGLHISVRGEGLKTDLGTVIDAKAISAPDGELRVLDGKEPKPPKEPKRRREPKLSSEGEAAR